MPWRADFSTVPPPIQPHISNKPRSFAEPSPLTQHPLVDLDIIWSFLCSSKGGLLIDQVNICCTINVMGCTRLQCFATFRHEFSCQSVVTGGAGWLVYPSSPWYHGTAFIVNMVPWYTVHSQHVIMVRHGRYTYHSPPTLPTTVKRDGSRVNCTDNCTISCTDIPIVQIVPFVPIYQPLLKSQKSM